MTGIPALSGALTLSPAPRPSGAEATLAPLDARAQPAGDAVRAIEASGRADGSPLDRRAEDNRRGQTAFDALRRSFGGDDPVRISPEGRARAAQSPAQDFEQAFGADAGGRAPVGAPPRARRFDDLFAGPPRARPTDARPAEAADETAEATEPAQVTDETAEEAPTAEPERKGPDGEALTAEDLEQIRQLEARDAEVRAHEQAHKSVGGRYAGGISYDLQTGPDGQRYAVGGEVPIDIGEVPGDPRATIQKMEVVRRAALAPAQPSGADRAVAAAAGQKAAEARVELTEAQAEAAREARDEASESSEDAPASDDTRATADEARPASGLKRVSPGDSGGLFVKRAAPAIEAPETPRRAAPGPAVAALRADG